MLNVGVVGSFGHGRGRLDILDLGLVLRNLDLLNLMHLLNRVQGLVLHLAQGLNVLEGLGGLEVLTGQVLSTGLLLKYGLGCELLDVLLLLRRQQGLTGHFLQTALLLGCGLLGGHFLRVFLVRDGLGDGLRVILGHKI